MTKTVGIDVGTGSIKTVLFDTSGDEPRWLSRRLERVRKRDPFALAERALDEMLEETGAARDDLAYVASTGEAETLPFATGHFYSMTTHARGGVYLDPEARSVLDVGAVPSAAAEVGIRPEDVLLNPDAGVEAAVLAVEHLGVETVLLLDADGHHVHALLGASAPVRQGERIKIGARAGAALFFDTEGRRIPAPPAGQAKEAAYGT